MTPGWFFFAHPIPHEIIPAKSNLPFSRLTAIGPPESPLVKRRIPNSQISENFFCISTLSHDLANAKDSCDSHAKRIANKVMSEIRTYYVL